MDRSQVKEIICVNRDRYYCGECQDQEGCEDAADQVLIMHSAEVAEKDIEIKNLKFDMAMKNKKLAELEKALAAEDDDCIATCQEVNLYKAKVAELEKRLATGHTESNKTKNVSLNPGPYDPETDIHWEQTS